MWSLLLLFNYPTGVYWRDNSPLKSIHFLPFDCFEMPKRSQSVEISDSPHSSTKSESKIRVSFCSQADKPSRLFEIPSLYNTYSFSQCSFPLSGTFRVSYSCSLWWYTYKSIIHVHIYERVESKYFSKAWLWVFERRKDIGQSKLTWSLLLEIAWSKDWIIDWIQRGNPCWVVDSIKFTFPSLGLVLSFSSSSSRLSVFG